VARTSAFVWTSTAGYSQWLTPRFALSQIKKFAPPGTHGTLTIGTPITERGDARCGNAVRMAILKGDEAWVTPLRSGIGPTRPTQSEINHVRNLLRRAGYTVYDATEEQFR
jgi:hypothetical protein